ncbi:helix-turn-helix domain-containing protein [Halalkalibacter alkalisediminis]|uniref:Helix-turn-helix domain-containing protein n=1 Tax=Halalkalibacter alkalisediminis TaxID=935616 RepID=A0ABV6NPM3_9BACI|nr:helix-turn-helix domain-containing protein [Halalkalibacter alkalisediminis]
MIQVFRGKYFLKILLLFSTSIITLMLCISLALYFISDAHLEKQLIESNLELVGQVKKRIENELDFIQSGISETIVNRDVIQALYNKQLENDYEKIVPLNQKLINTSLILKNVYSADLYLPASQIVISSLNGATSFNNLSTQRKEFYQNVQALRKPYWNFNSPSTSTNVISFFQPLPVGSNFPQGYFSIHVHETLLLNILDNASLSDVGDYYVMRRNERIMLHKDKEKVGMASELPSEYTSRILTGSEVGYYKHPTEDKLLFYGRINENDWVIIYEIPESKLHSNRSLGFNMLSATGIGLFLSIVIAFIIATYLYSPLHRRLEVINKPTDSLLFHEWNLIDSVQQKEKERITELSTKVKNNQEQLLDAFLVKSLLGSQDSFRNNSASSLFAHLQNTYPVVLVVEVEKSNGSEQKGNQFIMDMKRVCRDASKQYDVKVICVPIKDSQQFAIILPFKKLLIDPVKHDTILNLAERIQQSVQNELQLQISIGIGTLQERFVDLRCSFLEALEALQFKLVKGNNRIISFEELRYTDPLQYPYSIEDKIIKALKNDHDQAYMDHFDQFVDHLKDQNCTPESIYHAFSMLYTSLYRALDEHNAVDNFTLNKFYAVLHQKNSLRELKKWFKSEILLEFMEKAEQLNGNRSGQKIQKIMDYLQDHVTETHTLTSVSDHFDLNASYLSRLFKQSTGKSFVQYLTELKIQVAKQMLIETNLSVSEVATHVGYTERTFSRAFKKITNTTPANYRLKHK